jgi:hypothetical protein
LATKSIKADARANAVYLAKVLLEDHLTHQPPAFPFMTSDSMLLQNMMLLA